MVIRKKTKSRVRAHRRSKPKARRSIVQDKKLKAKKPGKRKSASGNVYYESRPNRSDKDARKRL